MGLIEEKHNEYVRLLHGEEIRIDDAAKNFESSWVSNGSAKIDDQTVAVINISEQETTYNTLIISLDKSPMVTKKTTKTLITDYRNEDDNRYDIKKGVIEIIYGHHIYCFPDIDWSALLIPLDGDSNKLTDYINFSLLSDIRKFSPHETTISFCNHLEMVIPKSFQANQDKFLRFFEYHSVYCYFDSQLYREKRAFAYLDDWQGSYYKTMMKVTSKVVSKLTLHQFKEIKQINELKHLSIDLSLIYEVLDQVKISYSF